MHFCFETASGENSSVLSVAIIRYTGMKKNVATLACLCGRTGAVAAILHRLVCVIQIQYDTIQYSTLQYSTIQYSTIQYSTIQYSKDLSARVQKQDYDFRVARMKWIMTSKMCGHHAAKAHSRRRHRRQQTAAGSNGEVSAIGRRLKQSKDKNFVESESLVTTCVALVERGKHFLQ